MRILWTVDLDFLGSATTGRGREMAISLWLGTLFFALFAFSDIAGERILYIKKIKKN